jgi:hypothetical protein
LLQNSSCYISANSFLTFTEFPGHQTCIIFHGNKFHELKFKIFGMASNQLFDFWQSEYCEKLINMYSCYQIQAVISPLIYKSPSPNFQTIRTVWTSFMPKNFMSWNLKVSVWHQINFSTFDNLNIVKNLHVFSLPNSTYYISANLYVTFTGLPGHRTIIIIFHGTNFFELKLNSFGMGSNQLFHSWQSECCEKLINMYSRYQIQAVIVI